MMTLQAVRNIPRVAQAGQTFSIEPKYGKVLRLLGSAIEPTDTAPAKKKPGNTTKKTSKTSKKKD